LSSPSPLSIPNSLLRLPSTVVLRRRSPGGSLPRHSYSKFDSILRPHKLITILWHFLCTNKSLQIKHEQLIFSKTYLSKWPTTIAYILLPPSTKLGAFKICSKSDHFKFDQIYIKTSIFMTSNKYRWFFPIIQRYLVLLRVREKNVSLGSS
jgi:hypothetical protein